MALVPGPQDAPAILAAHPAHVLKAVLADLRHRHDLRAPRLLQASHAIAAPQAGPQADHARLSWENKAYYFANPILAG